MSINHAGDNRKNYIINGGFDIWQRGTSQTSSGYGSADRWRFANNLSTKTVTRQEFTIGQTDVPGNPTYFCRTVVTSASASNEVVLLDQRIEDVTLLAGKTVTISFWAKADSNKNISVEFYQNFGSGGSTGVTGIGVKKFAITSSWSKLTNTFVIPDIGGLTVGDNNYLSCYIYLDAGAAYNLRTDSLGNQSGTFDIAQVQIEENSIVTDFEFLFYGEILKLCQRYYERFTIANFGPYITRTSDGYTAGNHYYNTPKRIVPTVTFSTSSWLTIGLSASNEYVNVYVTASPVSYTISYFNVALNAGDLSTYGNYVAWGVATTINITADAEL